MEGSRGLARLVILTALILAALAASSPANAEAPAPPVLVAPGNGTVRALVIGIDHYRAVANLRGATADARDIEGSLRRMGADDVTSLVDGAATRSQVLRELDGLATRSGMGDLVFITIAGHGAKEDERVKGSSPDGSDEVFLLVGFDPKKTPAAAEKILNHEFKHYIKLIEAKGAQVVFVADTCFGGGMAREVSAGAPALTYRQFPYRLATKDDALKPVSATAEAFLTELDFDRTAFLAAVDSNTKAPEIMIGDVYRGALSFAVARAIEGAADRKHDGRITLHELFDYAHSVVYQLSDARQSIVTLQSPALDVDRDIVMEVGTRSLGTAAPPSLSTPPSAPATAAATRIRPPLRLASMTGRRAALAGVRPSLTPFDIVDADDAPDLVWDPVGRDAYSAGDKIATDVTPEDLPGVVDRTAAVRDIKELVVKAPLDVSLLPDASLHRQGSRVEVAVKNVAGSNLVLVDITGVGEVQFLYPGGRSAAPLSQREYREPFRVREPYGADEVLAIASKASLQPLAEAIGKLDRRRSAGSLAETIARFAPPDARLGLVGLYTLP